MPPLPIAGNSTYARTGLCVKVLLAGTALLAGGPAVHAQSIETYFPSGRPGYDQELGVTVQSRLRPLYASPGIDAGGFVIRPNLDEALFYNSNVNGISGSESWGSETTASASATSKWSRDSLSGAIGMDHFQFFSLPFDNYTNWHLGLSGGYTIEDSQLVLSYYHNTSNLLGTEIASVRTVTPVANQTDSARINYTFTFSRLAITPDLSFGAYRNGDATVLGSNVSMAFLNHNVVAGGVTGRYSMSEEGGLLVVLRGVGSRYTSPQPGQPSNDSNSVLLLGGLDYQAKSVWRYQLLLGVETRQFAASVFPSRTAAIAAGNVIWQPTELTTVTGTLSRAIEDPQSSATNGFVLTEAHVTLDHELRRDLLLSMRAGVQYAQFLGGGTQTSMSGGASIAWLINRNTQLALGVGLIKQVGTNPASTSSNPTSVTSGEFDQSIVALTLRFAL
jgi:hypothetical protein